MAIALFPLLEGETIGSNLARYGEFFGLETTLPLRRRIFGYKCRPDTRLPGGLRHVAEEARDYWGVSIEEVVKNHTEFYYATATLGEAQKERMRSDMLEQPAGRCFRPRVCGWTGERATRLRYCDACVQEWKEGGVPAHWLVDHQLPGVYFCCRHSHMLRMVNAGDCAGLTDSTLTATRMDTGAFVLQKSLGEERNAIESIAILSARCRAGEDRLPSAETYRELLRGAQMLWPSGVVDERVFIAAMLGYLGREYCQEAGLTAPKMKNWCRSVAKETATYGYSHPLMFIVAESLLRSRCEAPRSFLPRVRVAEGRGCESGGDQEFLSDALANGIACTGILHRRGDVWKLSHEDGAERLVACSCGVSYLVPDDLARGRTRLMVKAYGERYRNIIFAGGSDGNGSVAWSWNDIVRVERFKRWARRAGFFKERKLKAEEIERLRSQWRALVERAPLAKRITSAYQTDPVLYRTLRRHDREWISAFNLLNRTCPPGVVKSLRNSGNPD
ncbi:hypothetical protein EN871_31255 [bacterium M00.F.Ca.ET.228.01.1.1]|nr:hypothetical protein EN871_31255 [bacterium M00.F.Ca.ET.228.01.1.1]TGR95545.1 hypothetical protein EN834_30860 [bacterium M00.F.Ca.ET.191.01.1.1]TGT96533.1 hypothetical protein EN798_30870 [bacterium M00.F.Ca.ET.155.01.1.1]